MQNFTDRKVGKVQLLLKESETKQFPCSLFTPEHVKEHLTKMESNITHTHTLLNKEMTSHP